MDRRCDPKEIFKEDANKFLLNAKTDSSRKIKMNHSAPELCKGNSDKLNPFGSDANWGVAYPLFDGDDPSEVKEEEFDDIVYSRMARFNEPKNVNTKNGKETACKSRPFSISLQKVGNFGKLVLRIIFIGAMVYALCDLGETIFD